MVDSWAEFCFRTRVIAEGDLYRDMISRFYFSPPPFTMLSYLVFLSVCVSSLINGLMVPFEKLKTLFVWLVGLWIRRRHWIEFITKDLFARNQLNDSRQCEWPSKGHAVVTLRSARVVAATSNISLPPPYPSTYAKCQEQSPSMERRGAYSANEQPALPPADVH